MITSTQWQLAREAADRYEQILVPAILGPAAQVLVNWAEPKGGEIVLDVGCGTGAAARFAAEKVGPSGRVIGIDLNAGMIEVAKSLPAPNGVVIEWYEKSAYELPIDDQTVDLIVCAQSLQFMADRRSALAEMVRVLKPSGRAAISLWSDILENPYFHALAEAIGRYVGQDTAAGLMAIFGLSNADEIRRLLSEAGFRNVKMRVQQLDLSLPKLDDFVPRHITATPMVAGFNAASPIEQAKVIQEIADRLELYTTETGVCVPFRTHLVLARK